MHETHRRYWEPNPELFHGDWRDSVNIPGTNASMRWCEFAELMDRLTPEFWRQVIDAKARTGGKPITQEDRDSAKRPFPPPRCPAGPGIYVLKAGGGLYKIGKTGNLQRRMKDYQTVIPSELLTLVAFLPTDNLRIESALHQCYANKRTDGEWFALSPVELARMLESYNWIQVNQRLGDFIQGRK